VRYKYEGKVEYSQQKLMLLMVTIVLAMLSCFWVFYQIVTSSSTNQLWIPFTVLLLGGNLYLDLHLSEKVSSAELNHTGLIVIKGHLYGLIQVKKHYTPNMEVIQQFLKEAQESETFSFLALDKQVNASIVFYNNNQARSY
jgi:hypothetical protein